MDDPTEPQEGSHFDLVFPETFSHYWSLYEEGAGYEAVGMSHLAGVLYTQAFSEAVEIVGKHDDLRTRYTAEQLMNAAGYRYINVAASPNCPFKIIKAGAEALDAIEKKLHAGEHCDPELVLRALDCSKTGTPTTKMRACAALSALCSWAYILLPLIGLVAMWTNWKIGLACIVGGIACAFLARFLDTLKYKLCFGREVGKKVAGLVWESGKAFDPIG